MPALTSDSEGRFKSYNGLISAPILNTTNAPTSSLLTPVSSTTPTTTTVAGPILAPNCLRVGSQGEFKGLQTNKISSTQVGVNVNLTNLVGPPQHGPPAGTLVNTSNITGTVTGPTWGDSSSGPWQFAKFVKNFVLEPASNLRANLVRRSPKKGGGQGVPGPGGPGLVVGGGGGLPTRSMSEMSAQAVGKSYLNPGTTNFLVNGGVGPIARSQSLTSSNPVGNTNTISYQGASKGISVSPNTVVLNQPQGSAQNSTGSTTSSLCQTDNSSTNTNSNLETTPSKQTRLLAKICFPSPQKNRPSKVSRTSSTTNGSSSQDTVYSSTVTSSNPSETTTTKSSSDEYPTSTNIKMDGPEVSAGMLLSDRLKECVATPNRKRGNNVVMIDQQSGTVFFDETVLSNDATTNTNNNISTPIKQLAMQQHGLGSSPKKDSPSTRTPTHLSNSDCQTSDGMRSQNQTPKSSKTSTTPVNKNNRLSSSSNKSSSTSKYKTANCNGSDSSLKSPFKTSDCNTNGNTNSSKEESLSPNGKSKGVSGLCTNSPLARRALKRGEEHVAAARKRAREYSAEIGLRPLALEGFQNRSGKFCDARVIDKLAVHSDEVQKSRQTAIILDWDDTLFPTTMLKSLLSQQYVGTPDGIRRAPMRPGFDRYCKDVLGPLVAEILGYLLARTASAVFPSMADVVAKILKEEGLMVCYDVDSENVSPNLLLTRWETTLSLNRKQAESNDEARISRIRLSVITNAMPDWVQACCDRYYPRAVKRLLGYIEVISAREKYFMLANSSVVANTVHHNNMTAAGETPSPRIWMASDAADPLKWKVFAFAGWIGQAIREKTIKRAEDYTVLVVGDSPTDIAAGHAMKEFLGDSIEITSVHFSPRPSTRQLHLQLLRFAHDCQALVNAPVGLSMAMHAFSGGGLVQNRRVSEHYGIGATGVAEILAQIGAPDGEGVEQRGQQLCNNNWDMCGTGCTNFNESKRSWEGLSPAQNTHNLQLLHKQLAGDSAGGFCESRSNVVPACLILRGKPMISTSSFRGMREIIREVSGEEVESLSNLPLGNPICLCLTEGARGCHHTFDNDDTVRHIESHGRRHEKDPHRFLYMVYDNSYAYCDTMETIVLSRRAMMAMQ